MIGAPPSEAGAVQATVTRVSPGLPVTPVGAPGACAAVGVIGLLAEELGPVPTPLIAATVNVYAVPFVSPPIVALASGYSVTVAVWATPLMYGVIR